MLTYLIRVNTHKKKRFFLINRKPETKGNLHKKIFLKITAKNVKWILSYVACKTYPFFHLSFLYIFFFVNVNMNIYKHHLKNAEHTQLLAS